MALRANAETGQAEIDRRVSEAMAARRATNAGEVAKARLASSSIRGAANGASPPQVYDTIREELEAAFAGS